MDIIAIQAGKRGGKPCIRGIVSRLMTFWNTLRPACQKQRCWQTSLTSPAKT